MSCLNAWVQKFICIGSCILFHSNNGRRCLQNSITVDKKKCEFEFILPTDSEFCRHNNLSDWFVVPFKGVTGVVGGYYKKHLTELEHHLTGMSYSSS